MILILSTEGDYHTGQVTEALARKGAKAVVFNVERFPAHSDLTLSVRDGEFRSSLVTDGMHIDLDDITAVWFRREFPVVYPLTMSNEDQEFGYAECHHMLRSLWSLLDDRVWVNPYEPARKASGKPYQLRVAAEVGFKVPRTLFTSSPDEVLAFADEVGDIVYKPLTVLVRQNDPMVVPQKVFTNRVRREDLVQRRDEIKVAPCTFQEYVPKAVELRVTVMGNDLYPVAIHSQENPLTVDDWRKFGEEYHRVRHEPVTLPPECEALIRTLMRRLGIVFGAFDLVVTPSGEYVFLEVNPSCQWIWVEAATGLPLVDRFADFLIASSRHEAEPACLSAG